MHFPPPTEEDLERAYQLLRKPWRYPSICLIGLLCPWEFVKWVPLIAAAALGLLLVTIFGVVFLMPLTMVFSVWQDVALNYGDSFTAAFARHREKSKRWGKTISLLGIKALLCFLQRWGNLVVQQLALLLITYYTAPTKAFWAYLGLLAFGFVLQWLGETELDVTKAWCLCIATMYRLYHLVYLSNLWGMGFKGCHPITKVAFLTKRYYIKEADDGLLSPVCDEFAKVTPNPIQDTNTKVELQCPVPYPLELIFSSTSTVHLNWVPGGSGSGTLAVEHKFSTKLFSITIPSIEEDYQFQLLCCEFGCARIFMFMRGVADANEVLMKNVDDISHCYSLRETITFVANPQNGLIRMDFNEEKWCC